MTASLLLFLLFVSMSVAAKNMEDSTIKRNERFIFKTPYVEKTFYNSMPTNEGYIQSDIPVFAKIIPINIQNQQVGPSFTGYIYSSDVPVLPHQNYIPPCSKESARNTEGRPGDGEAQIQELMTNFNELSKKVQTLAELVSLKGKIEAVQSYEEDSQENSDTFSTSRHESESTTPEIENPETTSQPDTTTATNVNTQSQIFQCEGVTCPITTVSCKVVERSVEPKNEKVVKTVYCLNEHGNTIRQIEKRIMNPNKGSSLNSSRTHDSNKHAESSKEKENFEVEMRNFQSQMNNAFGKF